MTQSEELRALLQAVADGRVTVHHATEAIAKWMVHHVSAAGAQGLNVAELVSDAAHEERERCVADVIRTGDVPVNRLKEIAARIERRPILRPPEGVCDRYTFELDFVLSSRQCFFHPLDRISKRWLENHFEEVTTAIAPFFEDVQHEALDVEGKRLEAIADEAGRRLSRAFPRERFTVTSKVTKG